MRALFANYAHIMCTFIGFVVHTLALNIDSATLYLVYITNMLLLSAPSVVNNSHVTSHRLVTVFALARLDYCNVILVGLSPH